MGRTTDEWAALLDGTTPGPWHAVKRGIDGPDYAEVLTAETETRGFGYMAYEVPILAGDRLDRDLPLAALAPDAVAEVIRLRRELNADTLEYRVEHQHIDNGIWHPVMQWSPEWPLNDGHSVASNERVVCRRVSEPWEVTNE